MTPDDALVPLATALEDAGELVAAVAPGQWALPTPCTEWTVRDLVNHLVGGNQLFARVLGGEQLPPEELRRFVGQDHLGDDPVAAFRATADQLLDAFEAPEVLTQTHTVPAGTMPGPAVLHLRIVETLVHGWDLARAIGRQPPFPEELAEAELEVSRELLGRLPEGRRPFAPSQPVADDAPAIDRLAALLGRAP